MSDKGRIVIGKRRAHAKASEEYIDVMFEYPAARMEDGASISYSQIDSNHSSSPLGLPNTTGVSDTSNAIDRWHGSIPIKYRRTGTDLNSDEEIGGHIEQAYEACRPENRQKWLADQANFWATKSRADVTKEFFDALSTFSWCCVSCDFPANPNWARRTQDLKEFGYTLATHTARYCETCAANRTHLLLVPLPRGGQTGYETWSPTLRARMVRILGGFDAYEGKPAQHLLPDHKFPEIRWDAETRRDSLEHLTDDQIRKQFQLVTNQRNQQKREVCRSCFQTGIRGFPFGIKFYYRGSESWPTSIPRTGSRAEEGCIGCGWHDLNAWRKAALERLR